jgi:hypothetical protein
MSDTLDKCCATRHFWGAANRTTAYVAPCVLGAIPRPEFWQTCGEWLDPARATAEQVMLQSQARGGAVPYWGQYVMGVKP